MAAISARIFAARAAKPGSASSCSAASRTRSAVTASGLSARPGACPFHGEGVGGLVGRLREHELGQPVRQRAEQDARPALRHDEVAARQQQRVRQVAGEEDVRGLRGQRRARRGHDDVDG